MKKLKIILFVLSFFLVKEVQAKILDTTVFNYTKTSNDFRFHLRSFFTSGAPGACPSIKWYNIYKSNDTVYVDALYDMRGMWPFMGCSSSDYIYYTNPYSDIKYITVSSGYISGPSSFPERDTSKNLFDSTFVLGTSTINDKIVQNLFNLYPNPTSQYLNLPKIAEAKELSIYNTMGQVVLHQESNISQSLDVSSFTKGFYFLTLYDKNRNKIAQGRFYKE